MRPCTFLRSALALVLLAGAVACAENATPTAPQSVGAPAISFAKAKGDEGKQVAVCKLQKEEWKTEKIGSKGGSVKVGGSELRVPPGALTRTITITAHTLPTTSASVQFSPEGLQFARPARLRMNYSSCQTPFFGVNIVYVQADTVTEVEPSNSHPGQKSVTADISHFSSYAVAY